jgi:uncharacterized protein
MITVENKDINDIPVLIVVENAKRNEPLPVITYVHGFTSAKEHNLPFAYLMAQKGYRVILPDCLHHGERDGGKTSLEVQLEFWNIVIQNLKEIHEIKTYVERECLLLNDRFGLAGTSMGGITTAAALTQYPWIKSAAILMGSPKAMEMAQYTISQVKAMNIKLPFTDVELQQQVEQLQEIDLSKQIDKLNNRPLLFWHGDADTVVPFDQSNSFYNEAKRFYSENEKLHYIQEKGRGHKVSRPAILATVDWFEKYL